MKDLANTPEKSRLIDEMTRIVQRDAIWSFGYYRPRSPPCSTG